MENKEIKYWSVMANADLAKVLIAENVHFMYNDETHNITFEAYDDYIYQLQERMKRAGKRVLTFKDISF